MVKEPRKWMAKVFNLCPNLSSLRIGTLKKKLGADWNGNWEDYGSGMANLGEEEYAADLIDTLPSEYYFHPKRALSGADLLRKFPKLKSLQVDSEMKENLDKLKHVIIHHTNEEPADPLLAINELRPHSIGNSP